MSMRCLLIENRYRGRVRNGEMISGIQSSRTSIVGRVEDTMYIFTQTNPFQH